MARAPELEAILKAWFDLDTCSPKEQTEHKVKLEQLLDGAIANSGMRGVSRRDLMSALRDEYREFARARYLDERRRLSRLK